MTAYSTYSQLLSSSRCHLICLQPEEATCQLYLCADE